MDASLRASLLAIDPATVEAGPETDLLVAKCLPRPTICPESWEWGVSRGWSPTKHWEAVREAAEAYIRSHSEEFTEFVTEFSWAQCWSVEFRWLSRTAWGGADGFQNLPLAICRAILSAARTEAEAETVPDAAGKVS